MEEGAQEIEWFIEGILWIQKEEEISIEKVDCDF